MASLSLNDFLRRLPEMVVDNITFHREIYGTHRIITQGDWKFKKIGYNEYDVRSISEPKKQRITWTSTKGAGDICILKISRLTPSGITVHLGKDIPQVETW